VAHTYEGDCRYQPGRSIYGNAEVRTNPSRSSGDQHGTVRTDIVGPPGSNSSQSLYPPQDLITPAQDEESAEGLRPAGHLEMHQDTAITPHLSAQEAGPEQVEDHDHVLATVIPTKEELVAELQRLTRVTEQQETIIQTLVGTMNQLRGRLGQMEEEWMGWVTAHSEVPLVVTPPGLLGPEHIQLSQRVAIPIQAGAGFTDPTAAWYESGNHSQLLHDPEGHRDQQAAQTSWPSVRQDTTLSLMPEPQGAPAPRLPEEEGTLGGVELPRREVDLAQAHGQEGVLAISRDSVSTRRPEVSGHEERARSIFG